MTTAVGQRLTEAQVVGVDGSRFLVDVEGGGSFHCFTRARIGPIVCGDRVQLGPAGGQDSVIEAVHPRRSLVHRCDGKRSKPIAANVDAVLLVLAVAPPSSAQFVDRALAAAEYAGLEVLIVLNKIDLDRGLTARDRLTAYGAIGYRTAPISALQSADALRLFVSGRASVLIGRSGVGKSTILNALCRTAGARTGAVSRTESGRHTTTRAQLYRVDDRTALIDAPGMQQFGVQHIPAPELAATFREFRRYLGRCRFHNCLHAGEPGCALGQALEQGQITPARMRSYVQILNSIGQSRSRARGAKPAGRRQQQDDEQP